MDVTSYLLGKQAGGGGGTPTLQDKSVTITENGTTSVTADSGYDGLGEVDITTNVSGGASEYFRNTITYGNNNTSGIEKCIKTIPADITISGTDAAYMFSRTSIITIPLLDTSAVQSIQYMFGYCSSLKSVPQLDLSNVIYGGTAFYNCSSLETIPIFNLSKCAYMKDLYYGCKKLTDQSLDNILQTCINAISYQEAKTLVYLGFNSTNYPASRIEALPHYQDFINAGWTIGY